MRTRRRGPDVRRDAGLPLTLPPHAFAVVLCQNPEKLVK